MVKEELFKNLVLWFILIWFNVFLVKRENLGLSVIKIFVKILKLINLSLIMFFSGIRYVIEFKGGMVLIFRMFKVKIVLVVY